jgi:YHS domain-containing protein
VFKMSGEETSDKLVLDPVCGMRVNPQRAAGHLDHDGTTYYFCSKGCVEKFKADPDRYLSGHRDAMPSAPAQVLTIGGLKPTQHSAPGTVALGTVAPGTRHPAPVSPAPCIPR